jgi:hypothetical protein
MEGQTGRAKYGVTHAARFSVFVAQLSPTIKTLLAGRSSAGKLSASAGQEEKG